jgi:hypothetical protein
MQKPPEKRRHFLPITFRLPDEKDRLHDPEKQKTIWLLQRKELCQRVPVVHLKYCCAAKSYCPNAEKYFDKQHFFMSSFQSQMRLRISFHASANTDDVLALPIGMSYLAFFYWRPPLASMYKQASPIKIKNHTSNCQSVFVIIEDLPPRRMQVGKLLLFYRHEFRNSFFQWKVKFISAIPFRQM